jgi:hypothetical protein
MLAAQAVTLGSRSLESLKNCTLYTSSEQSCGLHQDIAMGDDFDEVVNVIRKML